MKVIFKVTGKKPLLWLPLLLVLTAITALMRPILAKGYELVTNSALALQGDGIAKGAMLAIGGIVVVNLTNLVLTYLKERITQQTACRLRKQVFSKLLALPYNSFDQLEDGKTNTLLQEDVESVSRFFSDTLQQLLFGFCQTIFGLWALLAISLPFTLIAVVALSVGILLSGKFMGKIRACHLERMQKEEGVRSYFQNRLEHPWVTKIFHLEEHHLHGFTARYSEKMQAQHNLTKRQAFFQGLAMFAPMLANGVVYLAGFYFIQQGAITVGQLIGFVNLTPIVFWPFFFLPQMIGAISKQSASATRLWEILAITEDKSCEAIHWEKGEPLVVSNLTFGYPEQPPLFQNLSFTATAGEMIAITGESGSGKSTLIRLLMGFEQPDSGSISLQKDGQILPLSAKDFCTMPQQSLVIQDSIWENIQLGQPNKDFSAIISCAKQSGIDQWVESLPQGYHTIVQQGGKNFSGGQLQRIALARTLMGEGGCFIFDEPSSALDQENERWIAETLQQLSEEKPVILVTHNPELTKICTKEIKL